MKRSLVLISGVVGVLFGTKALAAENSDWKAVHSQVKQSVYQSSDDYYDVQFAEMDGYPYQNTAWDQVGSIISLLGRTREEINASGILTNEESGFDESDVIYYSGTLYGVSGSAYIDYTDGIAQMISIEFAISEVEENEWNVVGKIQQELNETMAPMSTSDNGNGLYTYTWKSNEIQVSLSDTVNEGWRMFALNLYLTKDIAQARGAFANWEEAYRDILYSPEARLEPGNGWVFDLIDLNQDGTPELVCVLIQGARAISTDVTVFTFRNNAHVQVPVYSDVEFSGLGGFGEYIFFGHR